MADTQLKPAALQLALDLVQDHLGELPLARHATRHPPPATARNTHATRRTLLACVP